MGLMYIFRSAHCLFKVFARNTEQNRPDPNIQVRVAAEREKFDQETTGAGLVVRLNGICPKQQRRIASARNRSFGTRGSKQRFGCSDEANQYQTSLQTDEQGNLDVHHLPYGHYEIEVTQAGFALVTERLAIHSSLPTDRKIQLQISTVNQSVTVNAAETPH